MTSTRTRGENICDECGLPMSICNAKALFELAVRRNGREAVIAAILDAQTEQPEATENYADPGSSSPSAATQPSETVAEMMTDEEISEFIADYGQPSETFLYLTPPQPIETVAEAAKVLVAAWDADELPVSDPDPMLPEFIAALRALKGAE